jgi:hypothetical protein
MGLISINRPAGDDLGRRTRNAATFWFVGGAGAAVVDVALGSSFVHAAFFGAACATAIIFFKALFSPRSP